MLVFLDTFFSFYTLSLSYIIYAHGSNATSDSVNKVCDTASCLLTDPPYPGVVRLLKRNIPGQGLLVLLPQLAAPLVCLTFTLLL